MTSSNPHLTSMIQAAVKDSIKQNTEPLIDQLKMYIKENTKAIEAQTKAYDLLLKRLDDYETKLSVVIHNAMEDEAKIELLVTLQDVRNKFFTSDYFFSKLHSVTELQRIISSIRYCYYLTIKSLCCCC